MSHTDPYIFPATPRTFIFPATGGDMPAGSFMKDPAEHYPVGITMARQLPTGRTVVRATVSAVDMADGTDQTSTVLARTTANTASAPIVDVEVKAGTDGHRYKLIYAIYDNANALYKESLIMFVRAI